MALLEHHVAGGSASPDILCCPSPRDKDAVGPHFVTTSETLAKSILTGDAIVLGERKGVAFLLRPKA